MGTATSSKDLLMTNPCLQLSNQSFKDPAVPHQGAQYQMIPETQVSNFKNDTEAQVL